MLREAIENGTFAVTCEFVPGRGMTGPAVEASVNFARDAVELGLPIHAVSLTDNPGGNPAIAPEALAHDILETGLDVLLHMSCRDTNRNAFESRATGIARTGVKSLLVVTGDYPEGGYAGRAEPVFDLDSVQALQLLHEMNAGLEVPGRKPGSTTRLPATDFLLAAGVSPFKMTEAELIPQFLKLEKKIAAGAALIIPQLGFNMRKFLEIKRYLLCRGLDVPVFGNVYVVSAGAAKVMNSGGVPGCVVTDELKATLIEEAKAPDKGKGKRLERAAKMTAAFKGMGFAGVHLGGFGLKTPDFKTILELAADYEPQWQEFIPELSFGHPDEFYAFPPPTDYAMATPDPDPLPALEGEGGSLGLRFWDGVHNAFFEEGTAGHRLMKGYYKTLEKAPVLENASHLCEYAVKKLAFGCRDCGDCALLDTGYLCPQSLCAKHQRNGPCGGSRDGMCEHYPDSKPCAWTRIYKRLKRDGELQALRARYVGPRKTELEESSGWGNYFAGRDHSADAAAATADAEDQS